MPPVQLFSEYLYFSSFSDALLRHARAAVEKHIAEFGLNAQSHVVEIASNDGYLLQNFVAAKIPCLGIEPAANIAKVAREKGIETRVEFFGQSLAQKLVAEKKPADLILGNNVFAHAPDTNDFVAGLKTLLKPQRPDRSGISLRRGFHRTHRVRHDLPRARFLFHAHGAATAVRAARTGNFPR